jgi:hypothetical protein
MKHPKCDSHYCIDGLEDILECLTCACHSKDDRIAKLEQRIANWSYSDCGWHHEVDCQYKARNAELESGVLAMSEEQDKDI